MRFAYSQPTVNKLCLIFFLFRKQISRSQWRSSQKKILKRWFLNITTLKFTEPRSCCLNLPERYFNLFSETHTWAHFTAVAYAPRLTPVSRLSFLILIDPQWGMTSNSHLTAFLLLLLSPLTSEKCSSLHHFITADGFPIELFLGGGATNGQWWKLAELDFKSVPLLSDFHAIGVFGYFWDVLLSSVTVPSAILRGSLISL